MIKTVGKTHENGGNPLLFDICSAMKKAARGSATTLVPGLNINSQIGAV